MSFQSLGLAPALLRALSEQGYDNPTPIQAQAIPVALEGRDLLAGAQTGTGKTAAFSLPLLDRLYVTHRHAAQPKTPRALVLTPTRELAAQVHESVRGYGKHLGVRAATIFGGVGMQPQVDALRRGVDILVATPGRLIDHVQQRSVNLSHVEVLILDEADRMLDMGFLPAIKRILGHLPRQNRITWLFSATFAPEIKALAGEFMRDPVEIQVAKPNSVAATVTHRVHPVDAARKRDLLLHLLQNDARQTLVFGRTKHGADKLATMLERAGLRAAAIHGNKSQNQRTRALKDFKSGKVAVLVATDIAARGLDIDQLPWSSTTTCRWSPRTTCTGSAAPAARAPKASRSRWFRTRKTACCATSVACSSRKSRSRRSPASNPRRRCASTIPHARARSRVDRSSSSATRAVRMSVGAMRGATRVREASRNSATVHSATRVLPDPRVVDPGATAPGRRHGVGSDATQSFAANAARNSLPSDRGSQRPMPTSGVWCHCALARIAEAMSCTSAVVGSLPSSR